MAVEPARAKYKFEHGGKFYYFCCGSCLEKFRADPSHYLTAPAASPSRIQTITIAPARMPDQGPESKRGTRHSRRPPAHAARDAEAAYVCPMCPEVRAAKPGPCPRCGMALEREMPNLASAVEYTCPMHPQIIRPGPGSCPICGMALEPRTVTAQEEENPELRTMTRRFWISLALTAPLLSVAMADMWPGMPARHALPEGG